MRFLSVLFAVVIFLTASGAHAATKLEDMPEVKAAEKYMNGITTIKAKFVQTAQNGKQASGLFMLKRPGRMRFEYQSPTKDIIVADGLFVYFYDNDLKEQRHMLISQSLADFFLRKDLKMSGDVKVVDVRRANGLLYISVAEAKDPKSGTLTLAFLEAGGGLSLTKWRVVDAQGMVTTVTLHDIKSGIKLDNDLFKYYDPELKKEHFN